MTILNLSAVSITEPTYTAAVYIDDSCTRLKSGLAHSDAVKYAEDFANSSSLNITEIAAIRD